jgi:hypothetical protein
MGCTPALLYTPGLLPFGWPLQGFLLVLNIITEPLLGYPHSHTLYHAPTNRSGVISAPLLPRFVRLLVSNTKSPRVKKQFRLHLSWKAGQWVCLWSMFDATLPGSLGIVIHQDHYRGHCIEKNNRPCNDAIKYKPLNQDDAL